MKKEHYGLTEKGGRLFEVLDAITRVCNDEKDTSSMEAEATVPEILASINRVQPDITTKLEVESVLRELEGDGLVYHESKES